jgi:hypothetical protein
MSSDSIPPDNDQHKPYGSGYMHFLKFAANIVPHLTPQELDAALRRQAANMAPKDLPVQRSTQKPRGRREDRKSGLWIVVQSARLHGLTPPDAGQWLRLPPEFDAIFALEPRPVAQVVLEVLRQTIGTVEYDAQGQPRHKEWAKISQRHFVRAGLTSNKFASQGIKQALEKGYIRRRQVGPQAFEYAIRWRGTN